MRNKAMVMAAVCGLAAGLAAGRLAPPAAAGGKPGGLLEPLVGKKVILGDFTNHPDLTLAGYDADWVMLKSANYRGGALWLPREQVNSIGGR